MKLLQRETALASTSKQRFSARFTPCQSLLAKMLPLLLLTMGFILYKISYTSSLGGLCLRDLTHQVLFPLNRLMERDKHSIILLVGQWFIEISLTSIFVFWTVKVKNMRLGMTAGLFYGIRSICLHIFYLPFPDNIVWRQPIVPSFMVPYDRTRDFYFSGHTGIAVVVTLEVWKLGLPRWVKAFCWVVLIWLIIMLVASRVHYAIDIVGGIFFAFLSNDLTSKSIKCWDYLWSLPALLFVKIKRICCVSEPSDNNSLLDQQIPRK